MKKLFNSLRFRFTILFLLIGTLPVILLHVIVVNTYQSNLINKRMIEIRQRSKIISSSLSQNKSIQRSLTPERKEVLNWYSDAYGGRIMVVDAGFRVVHDSYLMDVGKTVISDAVFSAFSGKDYETYEEKSQYLEYVIPITYSADNEKSVVGVLVFSSTTDWIQESLDRVKQAMILIEIILELVMIVVAVYVSYLLTRPIKTVSYQVEKIRSGRRDQDLSGLRSYNEVNEIITSMAEVAENYRSMEESQEQFVSNVSHELRTPMTSIRVLADSLLGQKDIPESVYQEFLSDISVEIDRESRIIEDLLSMSRLENSDNVMKIAPAKINDLLLSVLKTLRPIAEKRGIEVVFESFRAVTADVDEVKLAQAFTNLIENAVKYGRDNGLVKVELDADQTYFYLRVSDNGVGIPEDALPHIFDRFYRVDKARSRETGGTGLGLSITKQIVLMHYGVIKADSKVGVGTNFIVRIPLKHVEAAEGGKKR